MRYSRFASALILFLNFAMIENVKISEKWGIIMEYVTLCSLIVLVVGFGIDIWKTIKDRKSSHNEHSSIEKQQNVNKDLLTKDHDRISSKIDENRNLLQAGHNSILNDTLEIRSSVHAIDKQLAVEKAHREEALTHMTDEQKSIHNQIEAIYGLNQQLPKLRYENIQLIEENEQLEAKCDSLSQDNERLRKENQRLRHELNHEQSFDQTQDLDM